jgi:uncharacterized protein
MQMRDKLLLKKFKSQNRYYIYDIYSNRVIETDRIINDIIDHYPTMSRARLVKKYRNKYSAAAIGKACGRLRSLFKKKELLARSLPHQMKIPSRKRIYKTLNNNISHFSFYVADSCNLACKYCFLHYRPSASKSGKAEKDVMDRRTAELGVNFLKNHSKESRSIIISFSGGEPLINFRTIKYIVKLAKTAFRHKELHFNITTNATMLDEDIIRFLIRNRFELLISLDGPPDINDRYRVTPSGRPTSKMVEDKIAIIRQLSEPYFQEAVTFLSTTVSNVNIERIYRYFNKKYDKVSSVSPVREESPGKDSGNAEIAQRRLARQECEKLLRKKGSEVDALDKNGMLLFYLNYYYSYLKRISERKIGPIGSRIPLNHMCVPGEQASVASDGKLYICYQLTYAIEVGDVKCGFDYDKIVALLKEYEDISKDDCASCWAARLCDLCFYNAFIDGRFDLDYKRYHCRKHKAAMLEALKIAMMMPSIITGGRKIS